MATLLVRSSEDKVLLSGLGHSHFASDKGARIRKEDGGVREGARNRSRKGKNGQKKQPQRGLGVAQLEKLRLQEQSKHDACLASLHYAQGLVPLSSAFGFASDQGRTVCVPHVFARQVKGGTLEMNNPRGNLLSLGGGGGAGSYNDHPPNASWAMDTESSPIPPVPDPATRHHQQQQQQQHHPNSSLSILLPLHESELSPKLTMYPNSISQQQVQMEKEAGFLAAMRNARNEMMKHKQGDVKAAAVVAALSKLDDGPFNLSSTNCELYDPHQHRHPHQHQQHHHNNNTMELPMFGIPSIGERPKELSSFQNYSPNHLRSTAIHNVECNGKKRPWVALQDSPKSPLQCHTFDLNGDDDDANTAHYTTHVIRNALGKSSSSSCLPFLKCKEKNMLYEKRNIPYEEYSSKSPSSNDSFSSTTSFLQQQRKRMSSPSPSSTTSNVIKPVDFLSLRLSSYGYCVEDDSDEDDHQKSSLSLQETVTDVEDGMETSHSASSCVKALDLNLKLAL